MHVGPGKLNSVEKESEVKGRSREYFMPRYPKIS